MLPSMSLYIFKPSSLICGIELRFCSYFGCFSLDVCDVLAVSSDSKSFEFRFRNISLGVGAKQTDLPRPSLLILSAYFFREDTTVFGFLTGVPGYIGNESSLSFSLFSQQPPNTLKVFPITKFNN